uniref:Uncharacterized protein n=1 Tax=Macrostomum lignano TaxID=282301 RepID=A0A1I8F6V1_9PLAT
MQQENRISPLQLISASPCRRLPAGVRRLSESFNAPLSERNETSAAPGGGARQAPRLFSLRAYAELRGAGDLLAVAALPERERCWCPPLTLRLVALAPAAAAPRHAADRLHRRPEGRDAVGFRPAGPRDSAVLSLPGYIESWSTGPPKKDHLEQLKAAVRAERDRAGRLRPGCQNVRWGAAADYEVPAELQAEEEQRTAEAARRIFLNSRAGARSATSAELMNLTQGSLIPVPAQQGFECPICRSATLAATMTTATASGGCGCASAARGLRELLRDTRSTPTGCPNTQDDLRRRAENDQNASWDCRNWRTCCSPDEAMKGFSPKREGCDWLMCSRVPHRDLLGPSAARAGTGGGQGDTSGWLPLP